MTSGPRKPNSVAALQTALEYLRAEAQRLGLSDVASALDVALVLVARERARRRNHEDRDG
jgi:hypothetical protein